ncbi:MAG: TonB-dependent receptor [Bacteroidales bacterium]|nr:TonB-dependent receptor [Bacteroidales bacterium]
MLTGFNTQKAKDVSGNNFTDIPKYNRAVVTPKFFFDFNKNNHFIVGVSSSYENRLGGDIYAIKNQTDSLHRFFENNETKYLSSDINFSHCFDTIHSLTARANVNYYNRNLKTNTNNFSGNQITAFSEVSYLISTGEHNWVTGLNFYNDQFLQISPSVSNSISYHNQTIGIFSQDNWHLTGKFSLEPGIRYDYSLQYGSFLLPRLAMMYKFSKQFSSRLSGGLGYKLPTPFTDESERTRYQSVFFNAGLKSENSAGINLDFTYKTQLSEGLFLSFNQAFFSVTIQNPIIANPDSLEQQIVYYQNVNKNLVNKGMATNVRLSFDEFVLYVDYTHLDARKQYDDNRPLEFTPQNRLTTTLAYEDEETGLRTGVEVFYTGNQYRENGTKTPSYWLLGTSVQKRFGHFTIALNIENILNIRQTKYEHIVSGNLNNPVFNEIYAPLDVIVGNAVLKFDLF